MTLLTILNSNKERDYVHMYAAKSPRASPVFSLNFSSAGKEPFMDGKAKNINFSKRGAGGGTVE